MPLTREQFEDIKALVASRDTAKIEQAKRKLRSIDGDKAQAMLASLEAKYPTPARERVTSTKKGPAAAPVDDLSEVKSLIAQKRFDEAEALLWESDAPEAADLLKKITLVRSVQPQAKATGTPIGVPVRRPDNPASTIRRVVIIGLLIVVCAAAAGLYSDYKRKDEELAHQIRIKFAMQDVCFEVYRDEYFDKLGVSQFSDSCDREIQSMMVSYGTTVERCYDTWTDETHKLIECLVDGGAKFSGVWMLTGSS